MDFKVTMRKALVVGKFIIAIMVLIIAYRTYLKYGRTVMHREDDSMEPAVRRGQWVWVNKNNRFVEDLRMNQIIVYKHPDKPRELYVGRIKALPGEVVRNRQKDKDVFIPRGHVWVALDNPRREPDSRQFGPLSEHFVIGSADWTQVLPRDERKINQ